MKKIAILIVLSTLLLLSCTKHNNNIQTINGTISSIDKEYIYIDTIDGNGWAIYYEDGYSIGDSVTITFNTLGNDDVYDDEIVKIKIVETEL